MQHQPPPEEDDDDVVLLPEYDPHEEIAIPLGKTVHFYTPEGSPASSVISLLLGVSTQEQWTEDVAQLDELLAEHQQTESTTTHKTFLGTNKG